MTLNANLTTLNGSTSNRVINMTGVNSTVVTTATYAISSVETWLRADTTSNLVAFTAPNPAEFKGRAFAIKKSNTGANGITLTPYASETIEGAAGTYTLLGSTLANLPSYVFVSDGTNWWIL